jgi:hypothetical protein
MVAPEDLDAEVRAAQAGDEEAFRLLYRAQHPALLRYLRVLVGDEAEDIASEAWLQISRDLRTFSGDWDGFRGWTATVARHRVCAGVGGVALAANAGVLPEPLTSHLPGVHASKSPAPRPTPSGSEQPRPSAAAVPPGLAMLCRDFGGRGDQDHRTRALEERHFGELVRQAGGKDRARVEQFCARLRPSGSTSARPSGSAPPSRPSARPSNRPGDHSGTPNDRPSTPPGGSPGSGAPRPRG